MDPKEKRKRVMQRSIKLGHCVCDPRKPCPCPLFEEKNVCTCAGEHVPVEPTGPTVRLTDFVRSAGCASKIGQNDLHKVLGMLPVIEDPRLLVGTATADDAGVFQLSENVTLVQTVDVFTPGVDDAYLFGRIAACNSLSDVYAMGGRPVTALSVIGFPIYSLPHETMAQILQGGLSVLEEAGTILLGGHSINDEEIKFGFAVTGLVDPTRMVTNAGAQPGDMLVLTKPLGTGIISLAAQLNKAPPAALQAIEKSMSTLNRAAAEAMVAADASACTDVTGFGLLGHLTQMAKESRVSAEIWMDALPTFPGVRDCAAKGMYSGANERNADFSAAVTTFDNSIDENSKAILYDAQTSGGLLIAVSADRAEGMIRNIHGAGETSATIVGRIVDKSDGAIRVVPGKPASISKGTPTPTPGQHPVQEKEIPVNTNEEEQCCAHGSGTPEKGMEMFQAFMGGALQPGAIDVVTKEIVAVALGLAVHCIPCSRIHIKKALKMGIGFEELEEAAVLAVAFSGCRAMMLWNDLKKELNL